MLRLSALVPLLTLAACQLAGSADVITIDPTADPGTGTTATQPETTATEADRPVVGLDLDYITINQGTDIVLFDKGGDDEEGIQAPIIRQRDGILRVFVDPTNDWEARRVRVQLTVSDNNGEEVLEQVMRVTSKSSIDDLESTFNFELDGNLLTANAKFNVRLYENKEGTFPGEEGKVKWNSGDLPLEKTGSVDIVLIPFAYNWDGSGRLPDTSATQVERYRELMMGVYPATEINITVAQAVQWNSRITSGGTGWYDLLDYVTNARDAADVPSNTFFYGVFEPEATFGAYCSGGCILGLSNLGWSASVDWTKASIGIGYTGDYSAETLVHEVGHAHGREHAPCGVSGTDPQFPYSGASLGSWGYHIETKQWYNPNTYVDFMSYCSPTWTSDYQYYNLFIRVQENAELAREATIMWQTVRVHGDGDAFFDTTVSGGVEPGGDVVDVELYDDNGSLLRVTQGHLFPYSHLPGGTVLIPPSVVDMDVASVRVPALQ